MADHVTMPCGWGCGAQLTRREAGAHFRACPRRPTGKQAKESPDSPRREAELLIARAREIRRRNEAAAQSDPMRKRKPHAV